MAAVAAAIAPCPVDHERVKWTPAWDELPSIGIQPSGDPDHPDLELKNCTCGTTLCKPLPIAPAPAALLAVLTLDATEALAVGQTIRSLARDRKTPLGVRELLAKVGSEMTAAARAALAGAR